jgi:hypothetical protein
MTTLREKYAVKSSCAQCKYTRSHATLRLILVDRIHHTKLYCLYQSKYMLYKYTHACMLTYISGLVCVYVVLALGVRLCIGYLCVNFEYVRVLMYHLFDKRHRRSCRKACMRWHVYRLKMAHMYKHIFSMCAKDCSILSYTHMHVLMYSAVYEHRNVPKKKSYYSSLYLITAAFILLQQPLSYYSSL